MPCYNSCLPPHLATINYMQYSLTRYSICIQYMIVLTLLFLAQFAIACTCLVMSRDQQSTVIRMAWMEATLTVKRDTQDLFVCCGLDPLTQNMAANETVGHPPCNTPIVSNLSPIFNVQEISPHSFRRLGGGGTYYWFGINPT